MLEINAISNRYPVHVWIFSGVGFSVVAAIIFVGRWILNRHRSDGSISKRPFLAEILRDFGKRPQAQYAEASVRRILPFLSVGYVIYALLIAWFICRLLFRVYRAQSAGQMQLSGIQWMPLAMSSFFAFAFISICLCLALFLSARRWRRGALVLAGISCISIPIGTILGGLTIYALTRPEVSLEFTQSDLVRPKSSMLRAGAIILTFWAGVRLLPSPRILARFAYTFFSNPKAPSCRIHVSSERLKRSPARAPLFRPSQALGLLRSESDFGRVGLKSYCLLCREG